MKGETKVQTADMVLLFDYNGWATQRILNAAQKLTPEQFLAQTNLSRGNIRNVLAHMLGAEQVWRKRLQEGESPTSLLDPQQFTTLEQLTALWRAEEAAMRAFVAGLSDSQLNGVIGYRDTKGRPYESVLWHLLMHVVNHGTQHRAEVAEALTAYGCSPGDVDLVVYLREKGL